MSAQERIITRLQAEIEKDAQRATAAKQLERDRAEQQTSVGGLLAKEVYELYDLVDQVNLHTRNWWKPADFIMQKLTGRTVRRRTTRWYFDDVRGDRQRLYTLEGRIDGTAISIQYDAPTVTPDGSFQYSWTIDLNHCGIAGPSELGIAIYDTVTETRSGLQEKELRYTVLADAYMTGDSTVTSFTDGEQDDPLATVGKNSAEHALTLIRQARTIVENQQ